MRPKSSESDNETDSPPQKKPETETGQEDEKNKGRKRKLDETDDTDWKAEFFKANEQLKTVNNEYMTVSKENRNLMEENKNLTVEAVQSRYEMGAANTELMRLKGLLTPRGAVEYFESGWHKKMYPKMDGKSRSEKFIYIFEKDRQFQKFVKKNFGKIPAKSDIGMCAEDLHAHCSKVVHEFYNLKDPVFVNNSKILPNHLKLLCAICDTMGVRIVDLEQPKDSGEQNSSKSGSKEKATETKEQQQTVQIVGGDTSQSGGETAKETAAETKEQQQTVQIVSANNIQGEGGANEVDELMLVDEDTALDDDDEEEEV